MESYKTDCFYYTEVHDMGACISQCKRYRQLGKCPCDNCTDYISNKEVRLVIQDYVRNKKLKKEPKTDILDKIIAEIKEWYWQADKQALIKDPCVVDAMVDLFIRTIDKYKEESEE